MEGLIKIFLGLFLARSIASLFGAFRSPITGAIMLLVGVELVKFARDVRWSPELIPLAVTVAVRLPTNMAFGFAAGMVTHYVQQTVIRRREK